MITVEEMKRLNNEAGQHFFSPSTMRFWKSIIETELFQNCTFVTSEDPFGVGRMFSVRHFDMETHRVKTLKSQIMNLTLEKTKKLAKEWRIDESTR